MILPGVNVDATKRSSVFGNGRARQRDAEEVWEILSEDDLFMPTKRPGEKVRAGNAKVN